MTTLKNNEKSFNWNFHETYNTTNKHEEGTGVMELMLKCSESHILQQKLIWNIAHFQLYSTARKVAILGYELSQKRLARSAVFNSTLNLVWSVRLPSSLK